MSFSDAIARIEEMTKEFEAATGTVEVEVPGPPAGTTATVVGEFSCERLELLVEEHMSTVTELIQEKVQKIILVFQCWLDFLQYYRLDKH